MKDSDKTAYVEYRINKANEAYNAAVLLSENGQWNAAINRLYYAAYYAVSSLLVLHSVENKTHTYDKEIIFFIKFMFCYGGQLPRLQNICIPSESIL